MQFQECTLLSKFFSWCFIFKKDLKINLVLFFIHCELTKNIIMKNYLLLFSLVLLTFSCNNVEQNCEIVSNGFTSTEGEQVTMGSQESVDLVMTIDRAWKKRDYEMIKSLVSRLNFTTTIIKIEESRNRTNNEYFFLKINLGINT